MITSLINKVNKNKESILKSLRSKEISSYLDLVRILAEETAPSDDERNNNDWNPDKDRIHVIDDGHYQGTQIFVIAEKGYQPSNYWATNTYYGSCSGCDTLLSILDYNYDGLSEEQISDLFTLILHLAQKMKNITSYEGE